MSTRDVQGFSFEMTNLEVLRAHGYTKFVTFHNPSDMFRWKRQIGRGVDVVLSIDGVTYYIEESFCSHDYSYRASWFFKSRLERFRNTPESDSTHKRILLTNRWKNFEGISKLLSRFGLLLLTIDMLLSLLALRTTTYRTTCMHPLVVHQKGRRNECQFRNRFPDRARFQAKERFSQHS